METITKTLNLYAYQELSQEAKDRALEDHAIAEGQDTCWKEYPIEQMPLYVIRATITTNYVQS